MLPALSSPPVLAAMLALLAAGSSAAAQSTAPPDTALRLHGEHGLWVEQEGPALTVRWITARPDSGYLRVSEGGRVRAEFRTPAAQGHAAAYRPRSPTVRLEYGALHDARDRHTTEIDLRVRRDRVSFGRVDSLYVSADVHGDFQGLLALLRNSGLVDAHGRWSGGRKHLVFLGDLVDRGPASIRTLWFVYGLQRQAEAAGGRVHVLLGNHEIMVASGDLRYIAPTERRVAEIHGGDTARLFHPGHSFLGRWLASRPAVVRVGRVLLAHGGVTSQQLGHSLQALDDSLAAFVGEELFPRWSDTTYVPRMDAEAFDRRQQFFWGDRSVFWHRGYVRSDTLAEELSRVLREFRSDVLVIGHTAVGSIEARYGGALVAAHARAPATELLLLVRGDDGAYRRYRYARTGPPTPF